MSLAAHVYNEKEKIEKGLSCGPSLLEAPSKVPTTGERRSPGPVPDINRSGRAYESIIGVSPSMRALFKLIARVGRTAASVLITGESGTGKELVARAVHNTTSSGRGRPFVAVNCGAMPAELMESELFGFEKGAFTGAHARKAGKVELARGGTLFLDEVATMPLNLQVKLLRFLQEREFTRLGGNTLIKADLRIIAAANVNLLEAVKRGKFREDLYYRLNVIPVNLPPLRERTEDIPLLACHFLIKYSKKYSLPVRAISEAALTALKRYNWPGNVRELENIMERIIVLSSENGPVAVSDLPEEVRSSTEKDPVPGPGPTPSMTKDSYREALRAFERSYIRTALERTGWNRAKAARLMKVHRNTLLMKIKSLGIK